MKQSGGRLNTPEQAALRRSMIPSLIGLLCFLLLTGNPCSRLQSAFAATSASDILFGSSAETRGITDGNLPAIDASHAAVIDKQGTLCFGRAATEPTQIASLTKIMTAIVAIEALDPQTSITVTSTAASVGESSAGLIQGDTMSFDSSLKALLTASGNDAAVAIAEKAGESILTAQGIVAGGSDCESAFVEAMNAKAAALGMADSYFTNPHGLDFDGYATGQYSCAQDVATMLRFGMSLEQFRANIGFSQTSITVERAGEYRELALSNTDTLLKNYAGTCAAKTGFTQAAGPCVATAVNRDDGTEYYAVVLGSSSKPQRFIDSETLYEWIYANRDALQIPSSQNETPLETAEPPKNPEAVFQLISTPRFMQASINGNTQAFPVVAEVAHSDWKNRAFAATVPEANKTVSVLKETGRIEQEVTFLSIQGMVNTGDVVGHLSFRQGDTILWESDLIAAESIAAPTWWESIGVWFERTIGQIAGSPPTAESTLLSHGVLEIS